jgi:hypothetical protein
MDGFAMKSITVFLAAAVVGCTVCLGSARAADPWPLFDGCKWSFPSLTAQWQARQCCYCPDDYCKKTLPCVQCPEKGCVDDYCKKTLPCVQCPEKGCVDDYCKKTCPLFLWDTCTPGYTCGPGCQSQPKH